ncbi:MAG: MFS transporter [Chloroflexi bacterium]|nr:MFS transporter [Chloroflexota bacterium]
MTADSPPDARRGVLLAVLAGCSFVFPMSIFILSPLLVDVSREFQVSIAQAGALVTFTALPSALLAVLIGPLSDYLGRRPLLVGGTSLLALASFAATVAPTYELMVASRILSGLGAAAMGPSIFAAVGDLFPYAERGKAYGWTVGANTLASIMGIPMATLLAAAFSWRWSFAMVGIATGVAAIVLAWLYRPAALATPSEAAGSADPDQPIRSRATLIQSYRAGYRAVLQTRSALAVCGSSFSMSVGLMAFETYLGALLINRYHIGTGELAPIFGLAGLGTLIGAQIGGRLGDRVGHKPFMSLSVVASLPFLLVLAYSNVGLAVAAALNFFRNIPMGMRFTAASAIISEVVPGARATMQAINQSSFNSGVMLGSFLGGIIVEQYGYNHVALLTVVGALTSASLVARFVVEHRGTVPQPVGEEQASLLLTEPA